MPQKRKTTEEFLKRANTKHRNLYDYSKLEYKDCRTKVLIICKTHGEFLQSPSHHVLGRGCPKCAHEAQSKLYRKDQSVFIEEVRAKHGDKYDYSKTIYINRSKEIIVTCKEHGDFFQSAACHLDGQGCPKCGQLKRIENYVLSMDEFLSRAEKLHDFKYDYSLVTLKTTEDFIKIVCKIHGEFEQKLRIHFAGAGCKKCANSSMAERHRKSIEDFIKEAKNVHGTKYDYSQVTYVDMITPVKIMCTIHGIFQKSPTTHIGKQAGCPQCKVSGCSKAQVQWLNLVKFRVPNLQTYLSEEGEHKIQIYWVDGYCKESNTVYEFHGCFWHGCSTCFDQDSFNAANGKRYGDLFVKTKLREEAIVSMGYKLVVMWEHTWTNFIKHVKMIQRAFRKRH